MENQDEYILKIQDDGTRFYYKNNKLHREAGPALINRRDVEKFSNLVDEHLYKEVHKKRPKKELKMVTIETENGPIFTYEGPIEYHYSTEYYLDGKTYQEEEFNAILLEKELPKQDGQSKKMKL
jgi:hypothetical protein